VELAKQAANAGAHGLLVVTPYYNKPPQAGVLAHFKAVADATELPVMVYDIPGRAGIAIETPTLIELAGHPRILANKDAKADPFAASQVMARCDLAYYSGDDGLTLPLLALGAVGMVSVTGHLVADRHRKVIEAVAANDLKTARAITESLIPVTEGVMTRMQGAIATKAALDLLGRAGGGSLRLPLVPATDEQRAQLREELIAGGISL
jgi:4-hydroxy-tetrahydrodipicolinate synthase